MQAFIRSVFLILLTGILLTPPARAAGRYPEKEHLPVDYAGMEFTGFDETNLKAALSGLRALDASGALRKKDARTREEVQALYLQVLEEINLLNTQSALAEIRYDANGADQAMADASAELAAQSARLSDECFQVLRLLVDTPYQDIVEAGAGKENLAALRDYAPLTEERAALFDTEQRLVQDYDQGMAKPAEAVFEGEVWTEDSLEAAEIDAHTYREISGLLERARNLEAGELYRRLVQVRTQIAREAGYRNYAEYAYENIYNRDFSLEDIQPVWEAVKTCLVPLSWEVLDDVTERDLRSLEMRSRSSGEEILDAIQPFMNSMDPELGETFAFMREHHLYDIEYSDAKLPTGYTVGLPAYGTAFIFNAPYGDYQDYSDMVHEFGHFNETFHSTQHDLWAEFNIDVGEIHSQALELFFTSYADEVFGSSGKTYRSVILYNILESVLDGCMYDEFQTAVYEDPDMTLEEINSLFRDISEQYGYDYGPGEKESFFWVDISHTFQSPMYYISYATSALSALDLWLWSLEDEAAAVETYMDLTVLSLSVPYREAVRGAGLRDIFQEDTIPALAEELTAYLDGGEISYRGGKDSQNNIPKIVIGFAAVIAFSLLAGHFRTVFGSGRREKRRPDERDPWSSHPEKSPWEF